MLESAAKILWLLLSGAFIFGAWSSTLELRVQNHGHKITVLETKWDNNQERILEFMGRIDERLKTLERK